MFKKKKEQKKKHSSLEYYLCVGVILVQILLVIWDRIDEKKQLQAREEKHVMDSSM